MSSREVATALKLASIQQVIARPGSRRDNVLIPEQYRRDEAPLHRALRELFASLARLAKVNATPPDRGIPTRLRTTKIVNSSVSKNVNLKPLEAQSHEKSTALVRHRVRFPACVART